MYLYYIILCTLMLNKIRTYIISDIEYRTYTFTFVNLFTPSKTCKSEQIDTFQNLYKELLEFKTENLTLRGDLNLYLNP